MRRYHRDMYRIRAYGYIQEEARRSLYERNAGGNSDISEMYSMHYLITKYKACDLIYEMQIVYWVDYKMIDYICTIGTRRIGVSVTRAMYQPITGKFDQEMADHLINKKLFGLVTASNTVIKRHRFYYALLHVWCESEVIANYVEVAFTKYLYENSNNNNIFLLATVCDNYQLYGNILLS